MDSSNLKKHETKSRITRKQVRRRFHTSRPYQEKMLNMAEARREIVTALKCHRASMKRAMEKQQVESKPEASYCHVSPGFCAIRENLNVILPNQPLGLNLNLQDFNFPDSATFVGPPSAEAAEVADFGLHPAMELNDTLSLVNSAWWFEFLKEMEMSREDRKGENLLNFSFEEALEIPAWMNANENDFCSDDYVRDPALPCMDIEEIDGMDGDWLA